MTNFEYFIELLQDDEDLVNEINNMDTAYIPELFNYVSEAVTLIMNLKKNMKMTKIRHNRIKVGIL